MMKLDFTLSNTNLAAKGKPVIYRTTDPSFNTLELTVTNQGDDLKLKGGVPVQEGNIQVGGPTTMYFNAVSLLACGLKALGEMVVTADGYNTHFFHDAGGTWALSPAKDGTLAASGSIKITISNIVVGEKAHTGNISLDYYNFSGSSGDAFLMAIQVANKPVVGNKNLMQQLGFSWGENGYQDIYRTTDKAEPFKNALSFMLRNNGAKPIVAADNTEFTLSFVYADNPGYGALCTLNEGKDLAVTQTTNSNPWSGGIDELAAVPIWRFTPNGTVLGTGENAIASFSISQLVSSLQPGATLMYLSWASVPGYDDGQTSLGITKLMPPVISELTAIPNSVVFNTKSETKQVELNWQVDNWDKKLIQINETTFPSTGKHPFPVNFDKDGVKMKLSVIFGNGQHKAHRSCIIKTSFAPGKLTLGASIKWLRFKGDAPVALDLNWEATRIAKGPFLNDDSVAPTGDGHTVKVNKAELRQLPEVPGLPGKVFTLRATGLDGGKVEVTQFLPRTDFPISFPTVEASWSSLHPIQDPILLDFFVNKQNHWNDLLHKLSGFQSYMLAFSGRTLFYLKKMEEKKAYSFDELSQAVSIGEDATKMYEDLMKSIQTKTKDFDFMDHAANTWAVFPSFYFRYAKEKQIFHKICKNIKRQSYNLGIANKQLKLAASVEHYPLKKIKFIKDISLAINSENTKRIIALTIEKLT
jgi:hypothetical protein